MTLSQRLFDIECHLSEAFHISPFYIRQQPFFDFVAIVRQANDRSERENAKFTPDGRRRRKAKDDWF